MIKFVAYKVDFYIFYLMDDRVMDIIFQDQAKHYVEKFKEAHFIWKKRYHELRKLMRNPEE